MIKNMIYFSRCLWLLLRLQQYVILMKKKYYFNIASIISWVRSLIVGDLRSETIVSWFANYAPANG